MRTQIPRVAPWWLVLGVVALVWSAGCSVVGIRTTEEAPYEVVIRDGHFEVRQYEPMVVAETVTEGTKNAGENPAFMRLFEYIQGANEARQKIEMTAPVFQGEVVGTAREGQTIDMTTPVIQEATPSGWRMSFVLPSGFTMETAPRPTSPEITLRVVPGRRVASIRYSGSRAEEVMETKAQELADWVARRELTPTGKWWAAGYDPPFTLPALRRNEILVEVQYDGSPETSAL
ncbi:MAG: heme-binding protein [Planctomycetota bacterium]